MPGAFRMIAGDVNGDGRQDLAVSTGNIVHVFIGNGTGGFGPSTPFSTPSALQFELTDLNGDGRLDIAAAMNLGPGVAILLNGCGQPTGNLVLSAFDSPNPVAEGAPVTYSSTVTNAGASLATNVTLTETLAGQGVAGTPSSSQGACTISGNRLVTCNLGPLAPNASADVQVTFTPSVGGSLSTVIGVGSERPDSDPADNVVTLTTTVTAVGRQFEVTNTDNAGFGSLRQAILDSNADTGDRDTIVFNIPAAAFTPSRCQARCPCCPAGRHRRTHAAWIRGTPIIELNGTGWRPWPDLDGWQLDRARAGHQPVRWCGHAAADERRQCRRGQLHRHRRPGRRPRDPTAGTAWRSIRRARQHGRWRRTRRPATSSPGTCRAACRSPAPRRPATSSRTISSAPTAAA